MMANEHDLMIVSYTAVVLVTQTADGQVNFNSPTFLPDLQNMHLKLFLKYNCCIHRTRQIAFWFKRLIINKTVPAPFQGAVLSRQSILLSRG